MAILIKSTKDKAILIAGTDIKMTDVYGRLTFVGKADGKTMEIAVDTFASPATFAEGKPLFTDIQSGNVNATLDAGEVQSIETAHKYAAMAYESLGYEVEINLTLV